MAILVDVRIGQTVTIDGRIRVQLQHRAQNQVRLAITAPPEVKVDFPRNSAGAAAARGGLPVKV